MKALYAQFGRPSGSLGWLVGVSMGLKNANRSRRVLDLLAPEPGEDILEIGFGAGTDIARLLERTTTTGSVTGIDASAVMVRMASRRNRRAIDEGRARLEQALVPQLPFAEATFDAVYSVNSAQFWPELEAGLRAVRQVLRPGGRAALAVQARHRGASRTDSERWLRNLSDAGECAGLTVGHRRLGPETVPTAVVILEKNSPETTRPGLSNRAARPTDTYRLSEHRARD